MMKRILKGLAIFGLIILLAVAGIAFSYSQKASAQYKRPEFNISEEVQKADVELGRRIYKVRNGCIDCHGSDLAGAKIMENPAMGTVYGANITPYNLKSWTDEEIASAIRYGIHKSGRSLFFMPSFDYEGLSKGDVAAVIAYLRTVPEVQKPIHDNSFGPMARALSVFGQMPVMFPASVLDSTKGFSEKPIEAPTAEFGKYLAHSCVGCHGANYSGGKIPGGDPSWPEAANIRLGQNASLWTEENFKSMILSGNSPVDGRTLRPPMPVALLKQMNEMEIKALWLYLSSLN